MARPYATLVVLLSLALGSAAQPSESKPAAGQIDGPAELPREYVKSSLADTPAPGKTVLVKTSDELRSAIDNAACGDTIRLQAGAVFASDFRFPAKPCDDAHWIVLRTSAADADLPAEGNRITPCSGGVASLPGRPPFSCPTPRNVLARLVAPPTGSGPITFHPGANHYRFLGLEITREALRPVVYNLVMMSSDGTADHLVFDRVWMHGTAQDETNRGIALGGSRYVAVVDSYFNDFHCVAVTGACADAQAIAGGLGDHPMGPYKIVNNFLEGAAETILFGGGGASLSPADIEIRRNHLFKPRIWKAGEPGFVGGTSGRPFIVKNLFELKNAQRVLLEGNLLENTWGGFSQFGFAILVTPKNQNNHCPLCRVTDVVIRLNRVRHMASGIQIATGLSDAGGASSGGERYSIHDNIFDDIDGKTYGGFGAFAQISSTAPTLRDLRITHNTAFPPAALFIVGVGIDRERIPNFVFTDNLLGVGQNDFFSTGGGNSNCAFGAKNMGPSALLKNCFANAIATHNVLVGSAGGWPPGNFYPGDAAAVVEDLHGGDYRLCRADTGRGCKKGAAFVGKASDGKDPGADVHAVNAELAGVE